MKKIIVSTTINPPTEAIEKFDAMRDGYEVIVIGDKKTPTDYALARGRYVSPDEQEKMFPRLSDLLGWNCVQRRNIGFLIALEMGADVVVTVDDDNIPNDTWGKDVYVGRAISATRYQCQQIAFDPVGATNYPHLWHRGYPIQEISSRDYSKSEEADVFVRIQAEFWDGDPDIDAVCRMAYRPDCRFEKSRFPLCADKLSPFDSQNTFIDSALMRDYFMFPNIGRMDDIWGAYYLQAKTGVRPVFFAPNVVQKRNSHDLTRDFSAEVIGYEQTHGMLARIALNHEDFFCYLPGRSVTAFHEYQKQMDLILSRN